MYQALRRHFTHSLHVENANTLNIITCTISDTIRAFPFLLHNQLLVQALQRNLTLDSYIVFTSVQLFQSRDIRLSEAADGDLAFVEKIHLNDGCRTTSKHWNSLQVKETHFDHSSPE